MSLLILIALLHDEKIVTADVRPAGPRIVIRLHVGMERVAKGVKLPAEVVDLSELQLERGKAEVAAYLNSRMGVYVDGRRHVPVLDSLEPQFEKVLGTGEPFIASVVATFLVPSGELIRSLGFSYDAWAEYPGSKVLVNVRWGEGAKSFLRTGPDLLEITRTSLNPTFWSTAVEFMFWGMHHIFIGFDHVAFLLALLLGASKVGDLVKIVTSFTVAHSLTLLLSATHVISMPSRITEALIAASIVYVAVENTLVKDAAHRWILTFAFGLVHGLGFSEVLRERLGEIQSIALPVVSFNLGVELGQLAILAVAFPLLGLVRRGEKARLWTLRGGSAAILLFGLGWLVERLFNLEFMPL